MTFPLFLALRKHCGMLILLSAVLSISMICFCFYLIFEEYDSLPTVTFDFACIAFVVGFVIFLCLSLLAYFDPGFNYARTMRESRRIVAQPSLFSQFWCPGRIEEEIEEERYTRHEDIEMGITPSSPIPSSSSSSYSSTSPSSTDESGLSRASSPSQEGEEECRRCFGRAFRDGQQCTGAGGRCISEWDDMRDVSYNQRHFRRHTPVVLPSGPRRDLPTARVLPLRPAEYYPSPQFANNRNGRRGNDGGLDEASRDDTPILGGNSHDSSTENSSSDDSSSDYQELSSNGHSDWSSGESSDHTDNSSSRDLIGPFREVQAELEEWATEHGSDGSEDVEVEVEEEARPPVRLLNRVSLADQLLWTRPRRPILSSPQQILSRTSTSAAPSLTPPSSSSSDSSPPIPLRTSSLLATLDRNGSASTVLVRQHARLSRLSRTNIEDIADSSRSEVARVDRPRLSTVAPLPFNQHSRAHRSSNSPGPAIMQPRRIQRPNYPPPPPPTSTSIAPYQVFSRNHQPPHEPEYVVMGVPSPKVRQLAREGTSTSQLGLVRLLPLSRVGVPPSPAPMGYQRSYRGNHRSSASREETEQETYV